MKPLEWDGGRRLDRLVPTRWVERYAKWTQSGLHASIDSRGDLWLALSVMRKSKLSGEYHQVLKMIAVGPLAASLAWRHIVAIELRKGRAQMRNDLRLMDAEEDRVLAYEQRTRMAFYRRKP